MPRKSTIIAAGLAALVLVAVAVERHRGSGAAGRRPDVVLVVVDTLRADRVGCNGNRRGLTPTIDRVADAAVVFRRAYAQSSWTKPSIASLLSSRYQSDHGVVGFESRLSDDEQTLPESLRDGGYATAAILANPALRADMGFAQGFDHYEAPTSHNPTDTETGEWVNARAIEWARDTSRNVPRRPAFLYVQYMEPHLPYRPTEKLATLLDGHPMPDLNLLNGILARNLPLSAAMLGDVKDVYDAEVAEADLRVGLLLKALREAGMLDDAVVVITADHGEEFEEHGGRLHGSTLYEEVIHVPLVISPPGRARHLAVDEPVELIDVAPTVLELAGIGVPPSFRGRPLRAVVGPPDTAGVQTGAAFSELVKKSSDLRPVPDPAGVRRAIVRGTQKAIVGGDGSGSFYDLAADPGEQHPDALSPVARDVLQTQLARFGRQVTPAESTVIDEATRRQLRALGYVD